MNANCSSDLHRWTRSLKTTCALAAGHINFNDEVTAGLRLADGVLLVVDAVEGVMLVTDKVVRQAAAEGLPICLLLSKVRAAPDHASRMTTLRTAESAL